MHEAVFVSQGEEEVSKLLNERSEQRERRSMTGGARAVLLYCPHDLVARTLGPGPRRKTTRAHRQPRKVGVETTMMRARRMTASAMVPMVVFRSIVSLRLALNAALAHAVSQRRDRAARSEDKICRVPSCSMRTDREWTRFVYIALGGKHRIRAYCATRTTGSKHISPHS